MTEQSSRPRLNSPDINSLSNTILRKKISSTARIKITPDAIGTRVTDIGVIQFVTSRPFQTSNVLREKLLSFRSSSLQRRNNTVASKLHDPLRKLPFEISGTVAKNSICGKMFLFPIPYTPQTNILNLFVRLPY